MRKAKKVIIRTNLKNDFIEQELKTHLQTELGTNVEIVYESLYSNEGYRAVFQRRLDSIQSGFELLIDSSEESIVLPQDAVTTNERAKIFLKQSWQERKVFYEKKLAETQPYAIAEQQAILNEYNKELHILTAHYFNLDSRETRERLGRAEEYAVIKNGQPDVYTLTSLIKTGQEVEYILQGDKVLDPLTPELKQEYLNVLSDDENQQPTWYREVLPPFEQRLLRKLLAGAKSDQDIADIVQAISSKHRSLPGVANYRNHVLLRITERPQDKAFSVEKLRDVTRSSMIASRDIQKKPQAFRDAYTLTALNRIVDEHLDQYAEYAKDVVAQSTVYQEKIQTHGNIKVIQMPPVLMQTLITPLLGKQPDSGLYRDKNRAIAAALKQGKGALIREDILPDGQKVSYRIPIINTNHPLNPGRFVIPVIGPIKIFGWTIYQGSASSREILKLAALAEKELKLRRESFTELSSAYAADKELSDDEIEKAETTLNRMASLEKSNPILSEATKDLTALLSKSAIASFFSNNIRELFLSSLEQLVVENMHGVAYGSCVSGKDRKALEIIHTDAMIIYAERYGKLPKFTDKGVDRQNFVEIVAGLYVSRHQQNIAELNAPGSQGVKTPYNYYPRDIQQAIQRRIKVLNEQGKLNPELPSERALKDDDRLASNNETGKLDKKVKISGERKQEYLRESDKRLTQLIEKNKNRPIGLAHHISDDLHHDDKHHHAPTPALAEKSQLSVGSGTDETITSSKQADKQAVLKPLVPKDTEMPEEKQELDL